MDKRIIKALTSPSFACQKVYNRLSPFIKSDETGENKFNTIYL